MAEPLFKDVLQVGVVVRDLEASMRTYSEEYGIGPWEVIDVNPETADKLIQDELPAEHSFRVALAMIGSVQWELIEPLDDSTDYYDFLRKHGEGLHHVAMAVDDYGTAVNALRAKGHRLILGGERRGATWGYLSTKEKLGFTVELFDLP